ncbi:MAG TPA: NAD-dependent epimerase/dehydratase family protein, partial [Rhodospirillales bacterium]|nr:NAD-dependent epimerase/dehydratase family protein [Rhodospirillales bacterium]
MGLDLVTGGAGFIGSHLVDGLIGAGRRVRVIDNFAVGGVRNLVQHEGNPAVDVVQADISDPSSLVDCFKGAERVFHLAAMADIVPSIEDPEVYFRTNVVGTFNVVQAAVAHNVKRLVYVASSSCYGIPAVYPTPETAPLQPQYPYALTKSLGEQIVLHWSNVYRLSAVSLRFFNVYGPRVRTSGTYGAVFGVFLAQLLAGKPLTIVGDGEQTRDFTYVSDVVDALIVAADSQHSGRIYNVGTGEAQSVNRLVELLGAEDIVHIPERPGEPDCTLADIGRITKEMGWQPAVPFSKGVEIMLENIDYWRDAPVWT